jgi:hypothetical protein
MDENKRDDNQDVYFVEKIVKDRFFQSEKQYLIKWKGYPNNENTWESSAVMQEDIPELVNEYEQAKRKRNRKSGFKKRKSEIRESP